MSNEFLIGLLTALGIILGSAVAAFWKATKTAGLVAQNGDKVDAVQSTLGLQTATIQALREEVDVLKSERNEASENFKQAAALNAQLHTQLDKSDERLRAAELSIATMQGRLDEQRVNYTNIIVRMEKRIEELTTALAEKRQNEAAVTEQLRIETNKVRTLEDKVADLQSEAARLKTQVDLLQTELTRSQAARSEDGSTPKVNVEKAVNPPEENKPNG